MTTLTECSKFFFSRYRIRFYPYTPRAYIRRESGPSWEREKKRESCWSEKIIILEVVEKMRSRQYATRRDNEPIFTRLSAFLLEPVDEASARNANVEWVVYRARIKGSRESLRLLFNVESSLKLSTQFWKGTYGISRIYFQSFWGSKIFKMAHFISVWKIFPLHADSRVKLVLVAEVWKNYVCTWNSFNLFWGPQCPKRKWGG